MIHIDRHRSALPESCAFTASPSDVRQVYQLLLSPPSLRSLSPAERQQVKVIAPGAVQTPSLHYSELIRDPYVHFVLVTRPEWIQSTGNVISAELEVLLGDQRDSLPRARHWRPYANQNVAGPKATFENLLQATGIEHPPSGLIDLVTEDSMLLRRDLTSHSLSTRISTEFRVQWQFDGDKELHEDGEPYTYCCAYCRGGSKVRLKTGETMYLGTGQIGIWKGTALDPGHQQEMRLPLKTLNAGQPLWHGSTDRPRDYPRCIALHDVQEPILSSEFIPWP